MSDSSDLLAKLASAETDPVTRALLATVQERVERAAEIARIDGNVDSLKNESRKLQHEVHSLRAAKDDITRKLSAMSMAKDTFNVYDLEEMLNEDWSDKYQEIGSEFRKIRIQLGLPEIPKDQTHRIPGTPKNRQPRENHKAVGVEFCKKWGYEIPAFLR